MHVFVMHSITSTVLLLYCLGLPSLTRPILDLSAFFDCLWTPCQPLDCLWTLTSKLDCVDTDHAIPAPGLWLMLRESQ